jgi:UTP:GlnB (protein PII) uridylyltransferase
MSGYHPHVGAQIINDIGSRFGLSEKEISQVSFLVESHLIMAQLSFFEIPPIQKLISNFATAVENMDKLNMLFALALRISDPSVRASGATGRAFAEEMYKTTAIHCRQAGNTVREMEEKLALKRSQVFNALSGSSAGGLVEAW